MINQEQIKLIVAEILQAHNLKAADPEISMPCPIHAILERATVSAQALQALTLAVQTHILQQVKQNLLAEIDVITNAAEVICLGKRTDKKRLLSHLLHKTPSVEAIKPEAITGDHGLTLIDYSAYGVFLVCLPKLQPIETLISHVLGILAAGSSVIFMTPYSLTGVQHDSIQSVIQLIKATLETENTALTGLVNYITSENTPLTTLIADPAIHALVMDDQPLLNHVSLNIDKKVFISKATAVPVIIDQTADLKMAAHTVIRGANFDHNLFNCAEKVLIVLDASFDYFSHCLEIEGAIWANTLAPCLLTPDASAFEYGKPIQRLLHTQKIACDPATRVALVEISEADLHTDLTHTKGLPVLFVVRAHSIEHAIQLALIVDQGRHFMAIMHSKNIDHLSLCARKMQTSVFVKNAASFAAIGLEGEGFPSMTIANITGEGPLEPKAYSRKRRCVLAEGFLIR